MRDEIAQSAAGTTFHTQKQKHCHCEPAPQRWRGIAAAAASSEQPPAGRLLASRNPFPPRLRREFNPHPALRATFPQGKAFGGALLRHSIRKTENAPVGARIARPPRFARGKPSSGASRHLPPGEGFSPSEAQRTSGGKGRPGERFSVRRRRASDGVPCVRRAKRNALLAEKAAPARDFPSGKGQKPQIYFVYFKAFETNSWRKRSAGIMLCGRRSARFSPFSSRTVADRCL